jgi:hypothetical protein
MRSRPPYGTWGRKFKSWYSDQSFPLSSTGFLAGHGTSAGVSCLDASIVGMTHPNAGPTPADVLDIAGPAW